MTRQLVLLSCLMPLLALGQPRVLVEARLAPSAPPVVGGTIRLELDLLVDTWFSAPPRLPLLELPGATVQSPAGRASPLSERREGKTFFGLRFSYLITPEQARRFEVPALAIQVSAGESEAPLTVHSQPLAFVARPLPEGIAGTGLLVAREVSLSQRISRSHEPLRIGDSLSRELEITVDGVLAMRIPALELAEVDGLKRYLGAPRLESLDDRQGSPLGGRRVDRADYVVERAGHYRLPAIELRWWDPVTAQARSLSAEAIEFKAGPTSAYQPIFSLADDLQAIAGRHLSRYWLPLALFALLGGLLGPVAPAWVRRGLAALHRYRVTRQTAWRASAAFAWRQVPGQLACRPPQLGALYLWGRRRCGCATLDGLAGTLSADLAGQLRAFLKSRYGREPKDSGASLALSRSLPKLHRQTAKPGKRTEAKPGLRPLHPPQSEPKRTAR